MSSNIAAVAATFKVELLEAIHNLSAAGDTLKAALYYQNSGLGYATTAYSVTGEVSGTGYTAGGVTVSNPTGPGLTGVTAYWTPSSFSWTGLTISANFDCWLLYNASKSNRAIAVFTFPAQTLVAGTFTVTMPTNGPTTALLQVS